MLAVLIADSLWFTVGRLYGRQFLNSLVRFSLSIDSTLRTARTWFERFGVPLLGTTQIDVRVFVLWDLIGATAWASAWILGGAALQAQIGRLFDLVGANGTTVVDVLVLALRWLRSIPMDPARAVRQ